MSDREFKTSHLHFAAWLLAAKILTYLRTDNNSFTKQQKLFVFADPDDRGAKLEAEFFNGSPVTEIRKYNEYIKLLKEQFVPVAGGMHATH